MSLNIAIFEGRPTKDIEFKETKTGKEVGVFNLAVQRNYKNEANEYEADFIPCLINIHSEEQKAYLKQQIKKGHRLNCQGSIFTSTVEKDNRKYQNFTLKIQRLSVIDYQYNTSDNAKENEVIEEPISTTESSEITSFSVPVTEAYQPDFDNHDYLSYL